MNDFSRKNHSQSPTWPQHGYRREDKWNPSICVLRKGQMEHFENFFGLMLRLLGQILIADKRWVTYHAVELGLPRKHLCEGEVKKILIVNLCVKTSVGPLSG